MQISPSVASSDLFHLEEETAFADQYFRQIHIDVEDGVTVPNITMGMPVCQKICEKWNTSYRSVHLSVLDPMKYLDRVKECHADIVFLETDHLSDPVSVIKAYKDAGIPVGISYSSKDREQSEETVRELLKLSEQVVIVTNYIGDPQRRFQYSMAEEGERIMKEYGIPVWLDGNVTYELWKELQDRGFYAAVMGGAVYRDKELALKQFVKDSQE